MGSGSNFDISLSLPPLAANCTRNVENDWNCDDGAFLYTAGYVINRQNAAARYSENAFLFMPKTRFYTCCGSDQRSIPHTTVEMNQPVLDGEKRGKRVFKRKNAFLVGKCVSLCLGTGGSCGSRLYYRDE